jgi:hypothetical protein
MSKIIVPFHGEISTVEGFKWPTSPATGKPEAIALLGSPSLLSIRLPSGKQLTFQSKTVSVRQHSQRIISVMTSPTNELAGWDAAYRHVMRLARQFDIQDQRLVRTRLREWQKNPPRSTVSTRGLLECYVSVFLEVKPVESVPEKIEGWFVSLTFEWCQENWPELQGTDPVVWKAMTGRGRDNVCKQANEPDEKGMKK